jgi:anti-sigma B factor antagonist
MGQLTAEVSVARDGTHIVRLAGELDMATYERAARTLAAASRRAGAAGLTIDLSDLEFIDASGVTALVRTHNWARAAGVRIRLQGVHGLVGRVLGLCGLTDLLEAITSGAEQATGDRPGTGGSTP